MTGKRTDAVIFDHVSKAFGPKQVLRDVSFKVPAGETLCILITAAYWSTEMMSQGSTRSVCLKCVERWASCSRMLRSSTLSHFTKI